MPEPAREQQTTVRAQLTRFRIFSAYHRYDRASRFRFQKSILVDGDLAVRVSVGRIPQLLVVAYRTTGPILKMMLDHGKLDEPTRLPPTWNARGRIYTSIQVSQDVEVLSASTGRGEDYFWYDWYDIEPKVTSFDTKAKTALDLVVGRLVQTFDIDMLDSLVHESRTYVDAPPRPVQPVPGSRVGVPSFYEHRSVREIDTSRVKSLKATFATQSSKEVISVGRWLTLASSDSDPLKRFLSAFTALEVLSRQAEKKARELLLTSFASAGVAEREVLQQLLWPEARDEYRDPDRHVMFRFALMAYVLSKDTAADDVGKLRAIRNFRNNKIHGSSVDEQELQEILLSALEMVQKYVPLVAGIAA